MKKTKKVYITTYILLTFMLVLLSLASIFAGSVDIKTSEVLGILGGRINSGSAYRIIYDIRLPRIIAAIVLGGALSVSGFLLQTFFQNPIAGPYVLGISQGAKLFVAIFMVFALGRNSVINSAGMIAAAFLGSLISTGFVLVISLRTRNMSLLIVCGILIGYICSAITDLIITFAEDSNIVNLHNWSLGSLSGMNWQNLKYMSVIIILTTFASFLLSKPIGAYQLGEEYAINMGVNVKVLRILIITFSSLLSATVTAFAGPISFVGIAVPHLIKSFTKTARPLIHIPACFLGGGVVVLLCDGLARELFAPNELSIGTVTAILLVPVVIWMMLKSHGGHDE